MYNTIFLVLYGMAVGALVVAVFLVRQRQIADRLRKRNALLENSVCARDEEAQYFATIRLPALVENLHQGPVEVLGPQHADLTATPFGQSLETALGLTAASVENSVARADLSAKATMKAMMRTVQSLANEQQVVISDMQDRHDDPAVLEDLMKIDHANSQLGRRAQAAAVLCGSWPGQQRSAASVTNVVRGAVSRIRDYLRVMVHEHTDTALVSAVVEPVVLTVAELLDNAARYSPPGTSVEVHIRSSHNGLAIVIDDAGVGMNSEQVQHATRRLTPARTVDINQLGDPPQLGFAVIGILTARYHFSVSVDTRSPYGGVRAVVFLPSALLTTVSREPVTEHPTSGGTSSLAVDHAPTNGGVSATARDGLPKRRRREQVAIEPTSTLALPDRHAREVATDMGAWQRGTRSGRDVGLSHP
jgi:two-component sensor histidine kinase